VLFNLSLQPGEEGQSIVVVMSGESTFFVVGTAFIDPAESDPTKGRLLLVGNQEPRSFAQVSEVQIGGCAYALAAVSKGHVAAAINSEVTPSLACELSCRQADSRSRRQVVVFSIDPSSYRLSSVATWGGSFLSFNLVATGSNTLLVGDAMRSITVLSLQESPYALEEVARDYDAHYMTALESVHGDEYIGAESDLNLFTAQKEDVTNANSMADESALAPRGVFHLGEMVSKFQHGSSLSLFVCLSQGE
jgi:DNA damage-binding protein 1